MSLESVEASSAKDGIGSHLLPTFTLPSTAQTLVRLRAFKQRQPVLLLFFHGSTCRACCQYLQAAARLRRRIDELHGILLAIAPEPLETLRALEHHIDLPGQLLSDEGGHVTAMYTDTPNRGVAGPALYAVDRYGYGLARWSAREATGLPRLHVALDEIDGAEMRDCGCGLPAWPTPDVLSIRS